MEKIHGRGREITHDFFPFMKTKEISKNGGIVKGSTFYNTNKMTLVNSFICYFDTRGKYSYFRFGMQLLGASFIENKFLGREENGK